MADDSTVEKIYSRGFVELENPLGVLPEVGFADEVNRQIGEVVLCEILFKDALDSLVVRLDTFDFIGMAEDTMNCVATIEGIVALGDTAQLNGYSPAFFRIELDDGEEDFFHLMALAGMLLK